MSIEGQGLFFTIYFPCFVCFVLYKATISGERLQAGISFLSELFDTTENCGRIVSFNSTNIILIPQSYPSYHSIV